MTYPIHVYNPQTEGKPNLCLAHANGFPPEMYASLAAALADDYHVVCLPARPWWGDVESFTGWHMLADDLVAGIKEHNLAPVVCVGHSMSGVASVFAAVEHPELFRAIVLLDPVFVPPIFMYILRLQRLLRIQPFKRLVNGARKRRREWESFEDAYANFRKRSLFKRCSDEAVRQYTQGMTRENGNGVELGYDPEWEAQIFSKFPADEWRYPRKLTVPTLILGGDQSDTFRKEAINTWKRMRPDIPLHLVPDSGHLMPMEQPQAVAKHILEFLPSEVKPYAK